MKPLSLRPILGLTLVGALLGLGVAPVGAIPLGAAHLVTGSALYTYSDDTYQPFYSVDPAYGDLTTVSANAGLETGGGGRTLAMAWDSTASKAYGIDKGSGKIFSVNLTTGVRTMVSVVEGAAEDVVPVAMAIGNDGAAYIVIGEYSNDLYSLDLATGAKTFIASLISRSPAFSPKIRAFAVDPATGLFWIWNGDTNTLNQINVATGALSNAKTVTGFNTGDTVSAIQFDTNSTLWLMTHASGTTDGYLYSLISGNSMAINSGSLSRPKTPSGTEIIETYSLLLAPVARAKVAPVFTANTPTAATVGTSYSYTYTASGFPAPTFALSSGTLPAGLALNATSGVLSGMPTGTGGISSGFTVKATNGATPDAAGSSATITVAAAPVFTAASPPTTATFGTPYSYPFAVSGYPVSTSYSIATGSLPTGLSLSTGGVISGTPSGSAGTSTFTVSAANTTSPNATTASLSIAVTVPVAPTFTADDPATTATVGVAYSYTFTASGTPAPTFSISGTALPSEWALSSTGVLTGTPSTVYANPISVTVVATGYGSPATGATHTITVQPAPAAPILTGATPPGTATVGTAYTGYQFTATGYPAPTFATSTGTIPAGLTLSPEGLLSGTPTGTGGVSTFTVVASNSVNPNATSATLTITVAAAPILTADAPGVTGTVGTLYAAATFAATGYPAPTFAVSAGSLPPGLALNSGTGVLTGTPTGTGGIFTFTVRASNDVGAPAAGTSHTITVSAAPLFTADNPPSTATQGTGFSDYTFAASGTPAPTFTATGLPAGLSVDPTSGVLSGTPTDVGGTYPFTVTASNGIGSNAVGTSHSLVLSVPAAPAFVLDAPPATATVGTAYSYTFTATGFPLPAFTATTLPEGWSLSVDGALTAMPTTPMVYSEPITFTVTATNGVGSPALGTSHTITVSPAPAAPVFTADAPASSGLFDTGYSYLFEATGYPAPTFALGSGTLPTGLTLVNGLLSGVPTGNGGVFTFRIDASNSVQSGVTGAEHTVTITKAPVFTAETPDLTATAYTAYTGYTFAALGYPTAMTFSVGSGELPTGLALSDAGVLSGTPTGVGGSFTFTVSASNAVGTPATSLTQTIVVTAAPLFTAQNPRLEAKVGTQFTSYPFQASGYPTAMTFTTASGAIPQGLTLSEAGLLSGTPTGTGGSFTFTVRASNLVGTAAVSVSQTIVVNAAPVFTAQSPSLSATVGITLADYQFEATGFPAAMLYRIDTGELPPGVTLSATGLLSGAPTGVGGLFTFTALAFNTVDQSSRSESLTMLVDAAPLLTADTPTPTALVGTPYSYIFTATGFPAPSYAVTAGVLPAGLTLSESGVLSGTPTAPGGLSAEFTVTAANGVGADAVGASHLITVNAAPAFTADAPPTTVVGVDYRYEFTATGFPAPQFSVSSGALPAGLTLSDRGVLAGRATTAETVSFALTARNNVSPAAVSATHSMVVARPSLLVTCEFAVGSQVHGAQTTITAHGLLVGSGWQVQVFSTPQTLGSGIVTLSGAVDAHLTIPADLPAGNHHLVLTATSAAGGLMATTVWFTISASGIVLALSTVGPTRTIDELATTGTTSPIVLLVAGASLIIVAGGSLLLTRRRRLSSRPAAARQ